MGGLGDISFSLIVVVVVVPFSPEPQRNVSIAAVRGSVVVVFPFS